MQIRITLAIGLLLAGCVVTEGGPPQTIRDSQGQMYQLIAANHFEMGAARFESFKWDHASIAEVEDCRPVHPVILTSPYYLATTEVTVAQFREFVKASGYQPANAIIGWAPVNHDDGKVVSSFRKDGSFDWEQPGFPQEDSHPVVGVTYADAKAYCDWLSDQDEVRYRLPTEAEWECACRAGSESFFSFGDTYRGVIHRHANIANVELEEHSPGRGWLQWLADPEQDSPDGNVFTAPVGSYEANPWGLHDMHGNVWEWCEDRYLDTYYQRYSRDNHGDLRRRAIDPICTESWNEHGQWQVIRGGSWFLPPAQCCSGVRGVFATNEAACYIGFRVARDADSKDIEAAKQSHQESEESLQELMSVAKSVRETHDNLIRIELKCEELDEPTVRHLAQLNYAVDLAITPPGRINNALVQELGRIKRLKGFSVSVTCEGLDAKTYEMLSAHPELQTLQLTGTVELSDEFFQHLKQAQHLSSINLQGNEITDVGLAQLPALKKLEMLHIASTNSNGSCLERFTGSPLRILSLSNLNDETAQLLPAFPTLSFLNLHGSPIGAEGLKQIAQIRKLDRLELASCQNLDDQDLRVLSKLQNLQHLELQETAAGDIAVQALADATLLRRLQLGSSSLSDDGVRAIGELVSLRDLTITAEATNVSDKGLSDFWRLVNLERLNLSAPYVTGEGFGPFAELPKLRSLSLSCQQLTQTGCEHLIENESLTELTIGDNQGGPAGFDDQQFLTLARIPNLRRLTLHRQNTNLTDNVVESIKTQRPALQVKLR